MFVSASVSDPKTRRKETGKMKGSITKGQRNHGPGRAKFSVARRKALVYGLRSFLLALVGRIQFIHKIGKSGIHVDG